MTYRLHIYDMFDEMSVMASKRKFKYFLQYHYFYVIYHF